MVVVGAVIYENEGKADDFVREYKKLAPKVRSDPGAIAYMLHRDLEDPCKFFFYEKYADDEARTYHTSTPHFKEFFRVVGPIMKGRPLISRYEEIG